MQDVRARGVKAVRGQERRCQYYWYIYKSSVHGFSQNICILFSFFLYAGLCMGSIML